MRNACFYKMADGSVIPHKGQKHFVAHTGSGLMRMTTNVADVDMPLMSVAQIVHNGGKCFFAMNRCNVKYSNDTSDTLEQRDGLYIMKMWIPKQQTAPFQGQS